MFGFLKALQSLFVKNASSPQKEPAKVEAKAATTSEDYPGPAIIDYKNDSERLEKEFNQLNQKNPELRRLLMDVAFFTKRKFNKNIVITMIYRTQEEQDEIYKDDSKYKTKKFKSPHQFFHAADLRSSSFESSEIKKIEDYLNNKYNENNYYKWTARDHTVGLGMHFHLQFVKG